MTPQNVLKKYFSYITFSFAPLLVFEKSTTHSFFSFLFRRKKSHHISVYIGRHCTRIYTNRFTKLWEYLKMYRAQYDGYYEPCSSKVPIFSLAARVATFASLVVTVVILQTNKATLNTEFRLTYSDTTCLFHSYRQVVTTN